MNRKFKSILFEQDEQSAPEPQDIDTPDEEEELEDEMEYDTTAELMKQFILALPPDSVPADLQGAYEEIITNLEEEEYEDFDDFEGDEEEGK